MNRRFPKGLVCLALFLSFCVLFFLNGTQAEARVINQPIAYDGHTHEYSITRTVAATCTANGAVYKACYCGNEKKTRTITQLGHNFCVKQSEISASCTSYGSVTYKCSRCTATSTSSIPMLAHNSYGRVVENATCTADGAEYSICSMCYTYNKNKISTLNRTGHKFTTLVSYRESTCEEDGVLVYRCSNAGCSETKAVIEPALGHNFTERIKAVAGKNCQEYGYELYRCTVGNCDETEKRPVLLKGGHDFSVLVSRKETSCEEDGVSVFECSNAGCSETKTVIEPALGHNFSERINFVISKNCQEHDYEVYKCTARNCNKTEKRILPSTGSHNFSKRIEAVDGKNCKEYGYEVYECTADNCNATEKRVTVKGKHIWAINGICSVCRVSKCEIEGHDYDKDGFCRNESYFGQRYDRFISDLSNKDYRKGLFWGAFNGATFGFPEIVRHVFNLVPRGVLDMEAWERGVRAGESVTILAQLYAGSLSEGGNMGGPARIQAVTPEGLIVEFEVAASGDATGVLAGVPVFMYTPSDDELAEFKNSEESSTPENETGDVNATVRESGPEKVNYNGESTSVYRGGNDFTIKSDEVKVNGATGNVMTSHGVSVDVNPSTVSRFGGAYRIDSLPTGLKIIQRGMRLEHYEIVPEYEMPLATFQELLNQIVVSGPY